MNKRRTNIERRTGFTIVETVIVISIAITIVFIVASFNSNVNALQNLVSQKLQSRADIDATLSIMTTEIRSAEPSALGAYPIVAAGTSSLTFYSDIDRDGVAEEVRYFASSTSIDKGVIKPSGSPLAYATSSEIVTDFVDNLVIASSAPLFKYYDQSYAGSGTAPLAYPIDLSAIRMVAVSFSADINPKQAPAPEYFLTTVELRNLKSN